MLTSEGNDGNIKLLRNQKEKKLSTDKNDTCVFSI